MIKLVKTRYILGLILNLLYLRTGFLTSVVLFHSPYKINGCLCIRINKHMLLKKKHTFETY